MKYSVTFSTIVDETSVATAIQEAVMQLRDLAAAPVPSQISNWKFGIPGQFSIEVKQT